MSVDTVDVTVKAHTEPAGQPSEPEVQPADTPEAPVDLVPDAVPEPEPVPLPVPVAESPSAATAEPAVAPSEAPQSDSAPVVVPELPVSEATPPDDASTDDWDGSEPLEVLVPDTHETTPAHAVMVSPTHDESAVVPGTNGWAPTTRFVPTEPQVPSVAPAPAGPADEGPLPLEHLARQGLRFDDVFASSVDIDLHGYSPEAETESASDSSEGAFDETPVAAGRHSQAPVAAATPAVTIASSEKDEVVASAAESVASPERRSQNGFVAALWGLLRGQAGSLRNDQENQGSQNRGAGR